MLKSFFCGKSEESKKGSFKMSKKQDEIKNDTGFFFQKKNFLEISFFFELSLVLINHLVCSPGNPEERFFFRAFFLTFCFFTKIILFVFWCFGNFFFQKEGFYNHLLFSFLRFFLKNLLRLEKR